MVLVSQVKHSPPRLNDDILCMSNSICHMTYINLCYYIIAVVLDIQSLVYTSPKHNNRASNGSV